MSHLCDNCGRSLSDAEQLYIIKIELFADPEVIITEEDLLEGSAEKLMEILAQMQECDVEEATDEVHECYQFDLCSTCRRRIHHSLKEKWKQKQ